MVFHEIAMEKESRIFRPIGKFVPLFVVFGAIWHYSDVLHCCFLIFLLVINYFLPLKSIVKELKNGELKRLVIDDLQISRHFYFTQRYGDENSGMNDAFIKFAKKHYNVKL